jgi:hypothetical protein
MLSPLAKDESSLNSTLWLTRVTSVDNGDVKAVAFTCKKNELRKTAATANVITSVRIPH